MALTRKMLEDLGLEVEAVQKVIDAHLETVNALKAEKEDLDKKLKSVDEAGYKLKIENLNKQVSELNETKSEFEKYKQEVQTEKARAVKVNKLSDLLRAEKVSEALIPLLVKSTDVDSLELTEDGVFKNNPIDGLKNEYSALFEAPKVTTEGTQTITPPTPDTKDEDDLFLKGFKNEK